MKTIVAKSVGWLLLFTLIISAFPAERVFAYYYEENEGKIGKFVEGMAMMEREGKIGYINKEGELVADYKYTDGFDFHEGMAKVSFHGKYGYINKKGKEVIKPQFDEAYDFQDGVGIVCKNYKWGVIDKKGKYVVKLGKYDRVYRFCEGMAVVEKNENFGFINNKGKEVIAPIYDGAYCFSEGLALVRVGDDWGYINKNGKMVISPQFDYNEPDEEEHITGFFKEGFAGVSQYPEKGFINKKGKRLRGFGVYKEVQDFHDGMARVTFGSYLDRVYGYINKKGKEVIPLQFDDASRFSEGLAWVRIRNKYFYINKKGKNITGKDEFSLGEEFREGRARVGRFDGSSKVYGIINKKGKVVIPLGEYEALNPHYSEGIIMAYKNNVYYFLDKDGEILFKIREESTDTYEDPYDPLKDDSDDYSDDYSDDLDDNSDDSYDYSDDTSWE